jgi:uncharacterized metal-binding protein YceD (DUF177 family)
LSENVHNNKKGNFIMGKQNNIIEAGTLKCRVCGCTDFDCLRCIERTGFACYWVEEDLCSACVDEDGNEIELPEEDEIV